MKRYGIGEAKPGNLCCMEGCDRRRSRSGMGTCGRRKCIDAANRVLLGDVAKVDNRDPSSRTSVKISGKWNKVSHSKTIKGEHCVVLNDGTAHRLSDIQEWK